MGVGILAVDGFMEVEQMLSDILRVVPYSPEHFDVWSPRLAPVIVEACSHLDSYWHNVVVTDQLSKNGKFELPDYFGWLGKQCATEWAVFFNPDPPTKIQPFQKWANTQTFVSLDWWSAYNKLKHDRFSNIKKATLENAVNSVAGLLIGTLRFTQHCVTAASDSKLLTFASDQVLWSDYDSFQIAYAVAEGKQFAYPIGWCNLESQEADGGWAATPVEDSAGG